MSGRRAPARTATPTPELPRGQVRTTVLLALSSCIASAARMRRSALAPARTSGSSACVASKRSSSGATERSKRAWNFSSTPLRASELSTRTAGAAAPIGLLGLDSRGLADLGELRDFALDVGGELLR